MPEVTYMQVVKKPDLHLKLWPVKVKTFGMNFKYTGAIFKTLRSIETLG
jgi:hypothetical protein